MRQGSHLKRSRGRPHSQGNGASSSPSIDGRSLAAAPSGHSGGHSGSSSRKHVSMRHQSFVSNGPDGIRVSGNGFTILEKYLNLARDASTGGDRIAAENFYQHAEHYFRMINANNEGQFTPQTPREHFEADIQAAGEAATPGDQAVDEAAINRETRETRESLGDDQIIYGENNGGHGMMPHMARTSESRYAERNMDDGRSSHRRSRHHDEEGGTGGPHLNHPNQTRGRGRFRERRPNQLYQTGAGRGGSGSSMQNGGASHQDYSLPDQNDQGEHRQNQVQNQVQNHVQNHVQNQGQNYGNQPMAGDNYAYQNPRSRHAPRYDLGGTEQPDVGMISGHHYGDGQRPTHNSSPQPSFELSPPQAAIPTNAHESIPSMERVRPRRMSLTPIPGRTVEGGGTRPNDGNLPHHSATQNRDSSENE